MKKIILKKSHKVILLLAAAGLLAAAVKYSVSSNTEVHSFSSNECFGCHFTIPAEGDTRPYKFVNPINQLCLRCHENLDPLSHVVGVRPTMNIPEGMPLDEFGMITCATCHDPHIDQIDAKTGKKTYFLRTDRRGKDFCLLCHEDPNHPGEVSIFSTGGGVTHRRSMSHAHGFVNYTADPTAAIDPISRVCVGCHDSKEDNVNHDWAANNVWSMGNGIGFSHPVGVNYEDAAWKNRELRTRENLDPRIKFFDGKIGCCTCHDEYQAGGGLGLVIGVKGSYQDLCLACHNV